MFAKKTRGATVREEKKGGGIAGLLWMLFGAIITLVVGAVVYKSDIFGFTNSTPQIVEQVDGPTVKPKIKTDTDNPDYQFYELLPQQEMTAIPETATEPSVIQERVKENIEEKAKNLKADVVVTGKQTTQENSTSANNSSDNDSKTAATDPVEGTDEMVIVYENSTYDGVDTTTAKAEGVNKDSQSATSADAPKIATSVDSIPKTNVKETRRVIGGVTNVTKEETSTEVQTSSEIPTIKITKPVASQANEKGKSYILQINTYENADEADRRRAQVLMAGVDARVVKNQVNNSTVYQVLTSKMTSPESVVRAQQNLQKNGIDSIIVEQRVN